MRTTVIFGSAHFMNPFQVFCAALLLLSVASLGAPGDLDPSFGSAGKVRTAIGSGDDVSFSVALQPDGKVVLGGYSFVGGNTQFAVVRYKANGALDPSFNGTGKVTTTIGTFSAINGVAVQSDGKVVAGGVTSSSGNQNFAVTRYLNNGQLDPDFGTGGIVTTTIGTGADVGFCMALAPDEKIVVAGFSDTASGTDMAVVRYLGDGTLDTSFAGTGKVLVGLSPQDEYCYNVTVMPDGRVVLTGARYVNSSLFDTMTVRLNENGTLDTSFNGTGIVVSTIGTGNSNGSDVTVQPDGKTVVVGDAFNPTRDFFVTRYNVDGTFDTTFRGTGRVLTDFTLGEDYAFEVSVQADGKIVAAGRTDRASVPAFGVVRYLPDGTLDASFGAAGKVTTDVGPGIDLGNSIALQSDGRIIVGGTAQNASNYDFAMTRYIGSAAAGPTLAGPILNPANGHVYYLLSRDSWPASEARAQALGGHLVTINDGAENQFVFDTFGPVALAQRAAGFKSLWIGYNDVEIEGLFQWSSGEFPLFTNWDPGQPQGIGPSEDFAAMAVNFLTPGRWHDIFDGAEDVTYGVVEIVPIALTGNTGTLVPGEGGLVFSTFGAPAIDNGNIGCIASIKPPNGGKPQTVIYGDTGGFVLARVGGPAGNGDTYVSLGDPSFGGETFGFTAITRSAPPTAFPDFLGLERFGVADFTRATRATATSKLAGLFSRLSRTAPVKQVAKQNGIAPGTNNAQFSKMPSFGVPRNQPGLVFTAKLKRGGTVTAKNDFGVWRETAAGGDSEKLLQSGSAVTVVGGGTEQIEKLEIMVPVELGSDQRRSFAPDGSVIASATLAGGEPAVVRVAPNGAVDVAVRRGDAVPGLPGAEWESFSPPAIRSGGNYTFFARVLANLQIGRPTVTNGIFAANGANRRAIAFRGDPFPGNTNQRFARFGQPAIGQSGLVAFVAALTGKGVTPGNRSVIMENRNTNTRSVARLGEVAPEAGPGVTFRSFKSVVVTDTVNGQTAFTATIKGPGVTARNNFGLWSTSSTGEVKLLLRTGQVTLAGNTTPIIRSFTSLTAPTANRGQGRTTDEAGFVTARVKLSDGRSGVLRIPLP